MTQAAKSRIDIQKDELISVSAAAALVPPVGVHEATITRWALYGIDGLFLNSVLIAGRRYTTKKSLFEFLAETNSRVEQAVPAS